MIFEAHSINAEHKDLIHDVAYDFYGQRMATCSSDQFVKVWDQDEHDNWVLTATWKAHSGSVWKVTWAHPEFGQVLATCSFDRTGAIWEEIVGEGTTPGERGLRHWVRRTNLVDSRTSVTDVKFGPKSLVFGNRVCDVNKEDSVIVSGSKELNIDENLGEITQWGFPLQDLYKLALKFYKEKEGKAIHFSYQEKLTLIAFTKQVNFGKYNADTLPPLGVLDVIGRDRRLAWQSLGDMNREDAMRNFVLMLDRLCPLFTAYVEAHKADIEARERRKLEEEEKRKKEEERLRLEEEQKRKEEEERARMESQRRQIQDALNQQTYAQFKSYAEQQYPGNPEQQAVLVRQLQDQHYHQYMQQVMAQRSQAETDQVAEGVEEGPMEPLMANGALHHSQPESEEDDDDEVNSQGTMSMASMWTRKDVREFKESIRREGGDAILRVGHGETVTVRVPTHEDGTCLFWEFATDNYDIGFGVYFEWSKSPTNQVSVHVSESEDEDDYELDEDDEEFAGLPSDVERGSHSPKQVVERPPLSVIVPVYRRDCMEEVYAGSHAYPGQGVYLLKFDNSYSFWRSKTVYYRVYYTRYEENSSASKSAST